MTEEEVWEAARSIADQSLPDSLWLSGVQPLPHPIRQGGAQGKENPCQPQI